MNDKYRVRCIGKNIWTTVDGYSKLTDTIPKCGWTGVRTDHIECECYDMYAHYCRALTPGPGCPRGIDWACPRCGGSVTGKLIEHRAPKNSSSTS